MRSKGKAFLPPCRLRGTRLHAVPKVATGRSGALAVKKEEAGWVDGWK
jgi:hypothetical protein